MTDRKPVSRMTPELLTAAREAYYDATRIKSVKADLDGTLLKVGEALLAAHARRPRRTRAKGGA